MVKRCIIRTCPNVCGVPGVSIYRLPTLCTYYRNKWLEAIPKDIRKESIIFYVCSKHFDKDCFQIPSVGLNGIMKRRLRQDALPTLYLYSNEEMFNPDIQMRKSQNSIKVKVADFATQTITVNNCMQVQFRTRKKRTEREIMLQRQKRILKVRLKKRDKCIAFIREYAKKLRTESAN